MSYAFSTEILRTQNSTNRIYNAKYEGHWLQTYVSLLKCFDEFHAGIELVTFQIRHSLNCRLFQIERVLICYVNASKISVMKFDHGINTGYWSR